MDLRWNISSWSRTRSVTAVCGTLPTLLGMVVLLGWYTHNATLIQVSPTFVPMQYNTALGFLVCGMGVLLAVRANAKGALAFGALAAMIGGLTLIEYVFGVDLGIDQLLMEHYVTVATSNPGRMAPNTALCFSLTGIALLLSANAQASQRSVVAISVLGSLTFGLGVIAFAGYAMGLETAYGWGHLTRMAVHTSAGFIVLGVGLVAHAWDRTDTTMVHLPSWFSTVVGIVVLTFTLSLWQALNAVEAIGIAQYFVITFGVILAMALSVAVNISGVSSRRARALEQIHHGLEAQVEERTKELQIALDNLPGGLAYTDAEMKMIVCNDQYREMFDLPEELLRPGSYLPDIFRYVAERAKREPGDVDAFVADRTESLINPSDAVFEDRTTDGKIHEVRRRPVEGGGAITIVTDVTNQRRAEEELRRSERRFKGAVRLAQIGYWVWDEVEDRCIYCSQEMADIHGVTPDEFLRSTATLEGDLDWYHPDDRERYETVIMDAFNDNAGYEITVRIIRRDGEIRHIQEYAEAILNDEGQIVQTIGVIQDVTDREQADAGLHQQMEELEKAKKQSDFFNKMTVGRELRMIELKKEIDELLEEKGKAPRYNDTG